MALGLLIVLAGLALLIWTISLFIRVGRGTLAPWNPTRRLVIVGPYAHLRNPMISGVASVIVGEAMIFASPRVALWAVVFVFINHVYFVFSEEPGLVKRFGPEYERYKRQVPRWLFQARGFRG